ncbi:hypothetical protein PG102015_1261 [Bifidobacterium pseudolongum subsp. globosum]|nr:hypothetical protein PG102015_1261 [Bifidobacterium pseudolongum subsp. globosum]
MLLYTQTITTDIRNNTSEKAPSYILTHIDIGNCVKTHESGKSNSYICTPVQLKIPTFSFSLIVFHTKPALKSLSALSHLHSFAIL